MGFRFRKSVKIAPGVRLNFGKKSTSVSLGGKGARFTINNKGKKTASVGIPGTGLYYTESVGGTKKRKDESNMAAMKTNKVKVPKEDKPKKPITKKWWFWIIVVGIIGSAAAGGGSDTPEDETPQQSVQEEVNPAPATEEETEVQEPVTEETPEETELPVEEPKVEAPVVVAPVVTPVPEEPAVTVDPEAAFREKLNQYNYVGSSGSDKYHYPKCRWTKEINDQNLVHFDTEAEAEAAGYKPCGTCKP